MIYLIYFTKRPTRQESQFNFITQLQRSCSVLFHAVPFHSVLFHGVPFGSISFRSGPIFHSNPFQSILLRPILFFFHFTPFCSSPFHSVLFLLNFASFRPGIYSILFRAIRFYSVPIHFVPFYSIPFHFSFGSSPFRSNSSLLHSIPFYCPVRAEYCSSKPTTSA